MYDIVASITKRELDKFAEAYGKVNAKKFGDYAPGTVRYVTFIGTMEFPSRNLVGAHHFAETKPNPADESVDFNKLFKATEAEQ